MKLGMGRQKVLITQSSWCCGWRGLWYFETPYSFSLHNCWHSFCPVWTCFCPSTARAHKAPTKLKAGFIPQSPLPNRNCVPLDIPMCPSLPLYSAPYALLPFSFSTVPLPWRMEKVPSRETTVVSFKLISAFSFLCDLRQFISRLWPFCRIQYRYLQPLFGTWDFFSKAPAS